jgi:ankyrin repeat protein
VQKDGGSPLSHASRFGHAGAVEVLLSYGADVNHARVSTVELARASACLCNSAPKVWLSRSATRRRHPLPQADGLTPLLLAKTQRHEAVAALLVAAGAVL